MISPSSVESVGIDVGKDNLDVACRRHNKSVVKQTFRNNKKGVNEVLRFLEKQRTVATVPCVLESTGDYHLLASLMLRDGGAAVKCINPIITKKHVKSSIRGAKSDKIDCAMLAKIGVIEADLPDFVDTRDSIRARKLLAAVAQLETIKQQYRAHFTRLKETCELLGFKADMSEVKKVIALLDKQMKKYRAEIVAAAPSEARQLADMLPGVSQQNASVILIAIGAKQFANRDQLVAFVGLDVRVQESGNWKGKQRLSKRGNGYLRKILFQTAWGLWRHHPDFALKYKEVRADGKGHKTALVILARKFLRFLFAFYWKRTIQVTLKSGAPVQEQAPSISLPVSSPLRSLDGQQTQHVVP